MPRKQQPQLEHPLATLHRRWRMLTPQQQAHVQAVLQRADRDAMRLADVARRKGTNPEPYGGNYRRRAITHASNAGALRIAMELLAAVGCLP